MINTLPIPGHAGIYGVRGLIVREDQVRDKLRSVEVFEVLRGRPHAFLTTEAT